MKLYSSYRQPSQALIALAISAFAASAFAGCSDSKSNGDNASGPAGGSAEAASAGDSDKHAGEEHGDESRVTLTEAEMATAGIGVAEVTAEPVVAERAALDVPGQVEHDPRRVAIISPRTSGRIERLPVVEGDHVRAGQTVALLTSPAFLTAQNDLAQAARRASILAGTPDAQGASALVSAARRRLSLLGAGTALIRRVEGGAEPSLVLAVAAPFGGTIIEASVLAGTAVEAGTPLFKIADLSVVDVVAEVPERALSLLRIGLDASIRIPAYPNLRFAGTVERLHSELNPTTRTVRAVIHVSNRGGALRPGMFASVQFPVTMGAALATATAPGGTSPTTGSVLTIPETALVTDGSNRLLFVEVAPRTFEKRIVQVASLAPPGSGNSTSGRVAIASGVKAGERVVIRGAFTLKSELAKASFSDEH
ncbi:MAG: efflux RND transporter periplasmic adaptor subunit [Gemmatimonadaceae bacterium]